MHILGTLPCGCVLAYRRWHDDDPAIRSDDYYSVNLCAGHASDLLSSVEPGTCRLSMLPRVAARNVADLIRLALEGPPPDAERYGTVATAKSSLEAALRELKTITG